MFQNSMAIIKTIAKTNPLPQKEQKRLVQKILEGDVNARNRYIETNLKFVLAQALKFRNAKVDLSDLISEGVIGFQEACKKYNPAAGASLLTYSKNWIYARMQRFMCERHLIHIPLNKQDEIRHGNKAEDLSDKLAQIEVINRISNIDAPLGDEEGQCLSDILTTGEDCSAYTIACTRTKLLREAINNLSEKQKEVILNSFTCDDEGVAAKAIASKYNVSAARISMIKKQALKKLAESNAARKALAIS